jgi:hypothetical protein
MLRVTLKHIMLSLPAQSNARIWISIFRVHQSQLKLFFLLTIKLMLFKDAPSFSIE